MCVQKSICVDVSKILGICALSYITHSRMPMCKTCLLLLVCRSAAAKNHEFLQSSKLFFRSEIVVTLHTYFTQYLCSVKQNAAMETECSGCFLNCINMKSWRLQEIFYMMINTAEEEILYPEY